MTLKELRNRFPEYRDLSDDELLHEIHSSSYSDMNYDEFVAEVVDQPDDANIVANLKQVTDYLSEIRHILAYPRPETIYSDKFEALQTAIDALATQLKEVKPPVVNVEAPVVNVPEVVVPTIKVPKIELPAIPAPIVTVEAPVIDIPAANITFPDPITEWKFTVVRDRNGYIQDVIAKAV